ncbi:Nucleolar protein 13 [Cytospora mali]|uniref:Nucleolar protein 13 n=1 Tax=Cytospora mali TaxID=578113 RepID=A0A194WDM7_CYTMA|nr:Nucleolar protein 13 [Valsa mali]
MATETETPTREQTPEVEAPTKKSKKRKNDITELEVDLTLPEPPSKKAKRLLKKGKPLPKKQDSDDEDDNADGEAKKDGSSADADADNKAKTTKKERSPYGVWIGNLRFTVTKEDLRAWLIENSGGSITGEMMTRVHLPSSKLKGSKRPASAGGGDAAAAFENKGYAYVDFTTYEATMAAIALSETEWHRRPLLIKDAKSFDGRPKKEAADEAAAGADGKAGAGAAAAPVSTSRKVFVGNLSFQTTEDDLHELFSPCGEIEWLKVAQFEDTGKCKGYAWVKFKEAESADWAVKGFVKIKEVEETEEDFMDVDEKDDEDDSKAKDAEDAEEEEEEKEEEEKEEEKADADGSDDDSDSKAKKAKKASKKPKKEERKVKTRKWWVNTLHGRRLKLEHAEDDQTRYKKRYGKDGAKNTRGGGKFQQQQQKPQQAPRQSNGKHNNDARRVRNEAANGERDTESAAAKEPAKPAEVSNFRQDINVARLTGAPVKSEGKKITFD